MILGLVASVMAAVVALLEPTSIEDREFDKLVAHSGYSEVGLWTVRRNSPGSRVYLEAYVGRDVFVVEGGRVVKKLTRPALVAYLNDDGEFVAWTDSLMNGMTFKNGVHRGSGPLIAFGIDWGGRYFFIRTAGDSTEICAIAQPTRTLAVSQLTPSGIFAGDKKLYLVGRSEKDRDTWVCQSYSLDNEHASLLEERTIGDVRAVLDMDPATERLLVLGSREIFSRERVVYLHGDKKDVYLPLRFSSEPWDLLFLQPGVMGSH